MTNELEKTLADRIKDKEHRILNIIVRQLDLLEDISATIRRTAIKGKNTIADEGKFCL